jgi:predicted nucleotidyltransferase
MDTIPLLPDFLDLLRFLNEEKVEYLVVGGMAVNYYGYHRSTGDLDVWVNESIDNQDRLAVALRRFGFSPQTVARRPILEKSKFLRIGNQPVCVEIHADISGVSFADCLSRAETCNVQGVNVPFIGLADLRANKQAAGRTKDLADLEALAKSADRH